MDKPNGAAVPLPRGKIDLAKVFQAFADVGYDGVCSLEYEKDFEDNVLAVVESIAYERGICDTIKASIRPRCSGPCGRFAVRALRSANLTPLAQANLARECK